MSIGTRIANRRKELKMTQQELAEKLDVSFQAVSSWERDEFLPETDRLRTIANALSTRVSWLMEEDENELPGWELHDAMFNVGNMMEKVREYARAKNYRNTLKALRIMEQYHEGQYRKGKDAVPYIFHPLMLACHAISLDIAEDDLLTVCLLHDVLEDTEAKPEDLNISKGTLEAIRLLTFQEQEGRTWEESRKEYFNGLSNNRLALVTKLLDRVNNLSTMATGFTRKRMAEYIDETEECILPLLNVLKMEYDEYYNTAFLIKYQMLSLMETIKRLLQ